METRATGLVPAGRLVFTNHSPLDFPISRVNFNPCQNNSSPKDKNFRIIWVMVAGRDHSSDRTMQNKIIIKAGGRPFTASLEDNATARSFQALLPLTINMQELNDNEKYGSLSKSLPVNESVPRSIEAGDIMLYGSNTLVIFYESFKTSYRYTRIGRIDDVNGLQEALGAGSVRVEIAAR